MGNTPLDEFKIKASILLKQIQNNDPIGFTRLSVLNQFNDLSHADIKALIKRKHVLHVIALEHGFTSWQELKKDFDENLNTSFIDNYPNGYLNKWFSTYDEAKEELTRQGGFLLPYKNQFFICESQYISQLGFDPNDKDWQAIEYDWVKPKSQKAWQRLNSHWQKIRRKK